MSKLIRKAKRLYFLALTSLKILFTFGPGIFWTKLKRFFLVRFKNAKGVNLNEEYLVWRKKFALNSKQLDAKKVEMKKFKYNPLISIIMPVYNVDEKWLRLAIDSVLSQIYTNWELCIADDASTLSHIRPLLEEYAKKDQRTKVTFSEVNQNISLSSNVAIANAIGEFIFLMDNDDEVEPNLLFEFARTYNENPEIDFAYPDEDQLEIDGTHVNPILKPDWSPETSLSMMYTTRGFFRRTIVNEIGGFRKGYEGSQDYDLVLRFVEKIKPGRIVHIPYILYHWRRIPGSTAEDYTAKPYARNASFRALSDTIERRGIEGHLENGLTAPSFHIVRKILNNPKVSIIIPTKDKLHFIKKCVESIEKKTVTNGFTYEIIIINHESSEPETLKYFDKIKNKHIVLDYKGPFNYSALNNFAVKQATGNHLLFLNNDTEVINPDWLERLLEMSQLPEIGCVGAKLIFKNGTIQHAGVYLHENGIGGHIHMGFSKIDYGYMDRIQIIQNISAVTGACLMIKKDVFEKVGGFDEANLAVAFNDVDLCLKVMDAGYRNIYTPFAELYHYESLTRGPEDTPEKIIRFNKEREFIKKKWLKYLKQDKYYNPNLVLNNGVLGMNFGIKRK
jgi:glycosyltransferase involved in cell wall biosynthesis